jgi:uncharacterized protein YecT (DUF1311 family)
MPNIISTVAFCLLAASSSIAQSQTDLNISAYEQYKSADAVLNRVYKQIVAEYSEDKEFIKNLRASQRLWVQFRDAELLVKYPQDIDVRNGTVYALCHNSYMTKLTKERIATLKQWLIGERQGEVCSGSVRLK